MQSLVISLLLIIIMFLGWGISLMCQNIALKKKNVSILNKIGEYNEVKTEAKEKYKNSTDVETIKFLRKKHDLSLMEAKKIVDLVKWDVNIISN